MCESAEIRYADHMHHPSYPVELVVGCHCAEHMEEDYTAPRAREAKLRMLLELDGRGSHEPGKRRGRATRFLRRETDFMWWYGKPTKEVGLER
jgi:hypothetical protein